MVEERAGAWPAVAAVVVLVGLVAAAVLGVSTPAPRDADVPVTKFSAARAAVHVERIAAAPHVVGSAANDAVRGYLLDTLISLGLRVEGQDAVGADDDVLARVRNVIGVLPGTASTGRTFLVAHYDSVHTGPGASDDGSGVAAVLETVRALTAGPPLRNDVVVLFTDGEEACLCGAEAFVGQHPLAADGGVVLNLEARGSSGPPIMFETSPGNSALVSLYARVAPHPVASSVAVEVYRRLTNDTDFTEFLAAGRFTGLNSAQVDGSATYHKPQDTPDRLDAGTLQAHGDNALALTRELGAVDLADLARPAASDAVHLPVLGRLVVLPGALVWPLALLGAAAAAAFAWQARRTGAVSGPRLAAGVGSALVPLVLGPLAAAGLWSLLVVVRPGYAGMMDPWQPGVYRSAVVAAVAAVVLACSALLRRRVGGAALAVGSVVWTAVLGVALAAFAPGGSYLGGFPALACGVAGTVALALRRPAARTAAHTAGAAVAVLVLAPAVALFVPAVGLSAAAVPALVMALLGMAVLPAVDGLVPDGGIGRAAAPAVAVGLTVALTATGLAVDVVDAEHPVLAHLAYALDTDADQARWISREVRPGGWTSRYVTGREDTGFAYPVFDGGFSTGAAPVAAVPAPDATVTSDTAVGDERTVTVLVRPQRAVRLIALRVDGDRTVTRAVVDGREIPGDARFGVVFHAPPPDGLAVTLVLAGSGPSTLWVADGSTGLDGLPGFVPRPVGVGVAAPRTAELVLVSRTVPLTG